MTTAEPATPPPHLADTPGPPRPTWRTRATNWFFGLKPADQVLRHRAADLIDKLGIADHLKPGGVYVDIGSGTGHIPTQIARTANGLGARFVCIEPVSRPTKRVRRRVQRLTDTHIQFVRSLGDRLPVGDATADGVSIFFVLHHIPSPIQLRVLADVRRVLKPGGRLFIWEDTPENAREFAINETWDRRLNFEPRSEPHFYRSGDEWQTLLAQEGFELLQRAYYEDHSRKRNEGTVRHTGFILSRT